MNFSKLAFAILLGSASVGTAQKAGKATTSNVRDCTNYITEGYWAQTFEGADVGFPDGTSSCPRLPVGIDLGERFFNCADNAIRALSNGPVDGTEQCETLTRFRATADLAANFEDEFGFNEADIELFIDECEACPTRTGKSGKGDDDYYYDDYYYYYEGKARKAI